MKPAEAPWSCADNLSKQFWPKPGLKECPAWFESELFDILVVLLKDAFQKICRWQNKHM